MRLHTRFARSMFVRVAMAGVSLLVMSTAAHAQDGTDGDGETPMAGNRQPQLIGNQFTTTTVGSLQNRRPGLMVQQGIAGTLGNIDFPGNEQERQPGFFVETFELIVFEMTDIVSNMIDGLNTLLGISGSLTPPGGGGGTGGITPIDNAVTTGQGTTTMIE